MRKWFVALLAAALIAVSGTVVNADVSMPVAAVQMANPPMVVAHATGLLEAPMNSVQGVTIAGNGGAEWIELDIRFNKSNFPMGLHDATVDSVTPATGLLRDYWLNDAGALNSADFAPWNNAVTYPQFNGLGTDGLPKVHLNHLYWFMYAADGVDAGLVLDMKDNPNEADAFRLHDYLNRPEFADVPVKIMWNSLAGYDGYKTYYPTERTGVENWLIETPPAGFIRKAEDLTSRGFEALIYPWWFITPATINYYHANGLLIGQYSTNAANQDVIANWNRILLHGGDVLITNEVDQVTAYMNTLP